MKYMFLIFDNEAAMAQRSQEEMGQIFQEYKDYTKSLIDNGQYLSGEALQSTDVATIVRQRNGNTVVTDGPFIEAKEQLGGFYLVEAQDFDEATQLASRIPTAKFGSVEIRPVLELEKV